MGASSDGNGGNSIEDRLAAMERQVWLLFKRIYALEHERKPDEPEPVEID